MGKEIKYLTWSELNDIFQDVYATGWPAPKLSGDDEPFTFVQINYDYAYTSNSHQWRMTQEILKLLGVEENKE